MQRDGYPHDGKDAKHNATTTSLTTDFLIIFVLMARLIVLVCIFVFAICVNPLGKLAFAHSVSLADIQAFQVLIFVITK